MHHFIMLQIDKDIQEKIKINLTPEEIEAKYGKGNLDPEIEGPLYKVLAQILRPVAGI